MKRFPSLSLFLVVVAPAFPADATLEVYAIDTEGGKALLLVSPSGQTMLIDGGFPGFNDRDAIRVAEAAKAAAYQLHWPVNAPDDNPPDEFIANLQDSPDGKWIKVFASRGGSFTVTNARNNSTRTFKS